MFLAIWVLMLIPNGTAAVPAPDPVPMRATFFTKADCDSAASGLVILVQNQRFDPAAPGLTWENWADPKWQCVSQ
jgi:hypothetical protein